MADKDLVRHGEQIRKKILEMIIGYIEQHGYPPSIREIGAGVGLHSTSSVMHHINLMIRDRILETDADRAGASRALRVPGYRFVREDILKLQELYIYNQNFRDYVDKYSERYGVSRQQAFDVAVVREKAKYCMEEK